MEREKDMVLAQKRGLYGLGSQKCAHADKVKGAELVTLSGEVWIGYTTREPRPHARCSSAVQPVPITYHNQTGYGPWMSGTSTPSTCTARLHPEGPVWIVKSKM